MFGAQYHSVFDTSEYLQKFATVSAFQRHALDRYHEGFRALPAGLSVLDYGSGPSILAAISAAPKSESMILSDYTDANRKALHQWLSKDPLAFDWSHHFKYVVCQLEGSDEKEAEKRQEDVRRLVKGVAHSDLTQDPPIEGICSELSYDVVMSSLCICVASQTYAEYYLGIVKLGKLVKPGGVLMLFDVERKSVSRGIYRVGDTAFSYMGITREFGLKALCDAGFSNVQVWTAELEADDPYRVADPNRIGYLYLQGEKI